MMDDADANRIDGSIRYLMRNSKSERLLPEQAVNSEPEECLMLHN